MHQAASGNDPCSHQASQHPCRGGINLQCTPFSAGQAYAMQTAGSFRGTRLPQRVQQPHQNARGPARPAATPQRVAAIAAPPSYRKKKADIEPLADELKPLVEEKGVDWEKSGLKYLSNEARVRIASCSATRPGGALQAAVHIWRRALQLHRA